MSQLFSCKIESGLIYHMNEFKQGVPMAIKLPLLIPKEEKFFEMLHASAQNVVESVKALKNLVQN